MVPKDKTQQRSLTYVIATNSYQILHAYPAYKSSIFSQNYKNPMNFNIASPNFWLCPLKTVCILISIKFCIEFAK